MIRCGPGVLAVLLIPALLAAREARAQDRAPVVRALLFYSPTCPHCEELINNRLPPLQQRYGQSLDVIGINVGTQGGLRLYEAAVNWYMIAPSRQGVPTLVVGSYVLVGQVEIPTVLPQIVDSALVRGGIDWPDAPAIRQALQARGLIDTRPPEAAPARDSAQRDTAARPDSAAAAAAPEPRTDTAVAAAAARAAARGEAPERADTAPRTARPRDAGSVVEETAPADSATRPAAVPEAVVDSVAGPASGLPRELDADGLPLTVADRFRLDPVGNATAVAVLFLMTGILVLVGFGVGSARLQPPPPPGWLVPVLSIAGMGVAAYLAFVEVTGTEAVCGPVGDCNTVQQSEYAHLFGVLPVGVLGLAGYAAIMVAWLVALRADHRIRRAARLLAWGMAVVATLFSIYLTFLEPFVIGATCAWCLTSAVVTGLLLLATTSVAVQELRAGPASERVTSTVGRVRP
jgi:uncharacterized membrane protein